MIFYVSFSIKRFYQLSAKQNTYTFGIFYILVNSIGLYEHKKNWASI